MWCLLKLIALPSEEALKNHIRHRPKINEASINQIIPQWLTFFDLLSEHYMSTKNWGAAQMVQENKFSEISSLHRYGILFKEQFKHSLENGLPTHHSIELNYDFMHSLLKAKNLKQGKIVLEQKEIFFSKSIQYNFFIQGLNYIAANQLDYALLVKSSTQHIDFELQSSYFKYLDGLLEIYLSHQNVPDPERCFQELSQIIFDSMKTLLEGRLQPFYDLAPEIYSYFYLIMSHTFISATLIVGETFQIEKYYDDDQLVPLVLLFKNMQHILNEHNLDLMEYLKKTIQEWTTLYLTRYQKFIDDSLQKIESFGQKLFLYSDELNKKIFIIEKNEKITNGDILYLKEIQQDCFKILVSLLPLTKHPFIKMPSKIEKELLFSLEILFLHLKKIATFDPELRDYVLHNSKILRQGEFLLKRVKSFQELFL